MQGINNVYNFIYQASLIGPFYGATNIDILNDQTNFLLERCPWLIEKTVRQWLSTPRANLVPPPEHFDETLAAIEELGEQEILVFDLDAKTEAAYKKWVAAGKPEQGRVQEAQK